MTALATPAPDGVAPADSGLGTRMPAAPPHLEGDHAATRQHPLAEPDSAARDGRAVVVSLPTEIDVTNSLDVGVQLCAAIDDGSAMVIADMTMTRFCDTSGFRMLLVASEAAADRGADLRVVVPAGSAVFRTLGIMAFDQVLRVYPSLQDALPESGH
jgi:anti-sigma B factor antagonist